MKTRPISELLDLLIDHINKAEYFTGLCSATLNMRIDGIINDVEEIELDEFLYENRPSDVGNCFWWTRGLKNPRLEFLNALKERISNP